MTQRQALLLRMKILGALMREARTKAGKSMKAMAAHMGISPSTLSSYEHGRKAISLPELELFAYHLDVPLDTFWSSEPPERQVREIPQPKVLRSLRDRMIGALVRMDRERAGMSARQLAERVGISPQRLSAYEFGEKPVPFPELEALARALGRPIEHYVETDGAVGKWHLNRKTIGQVLELPEELRRFISQPANQSYLRLAKQLSEMSVEKLQRVAQGLLEITQ